jgi:hypothetical protein
MATSTFSFNVVNEAFVSPKLCFSVVRSAQAIAASFVAMRSADNGVLSVNGEVAYNNDEVVVLRAIPSADGVGVVAALVPNFDAHEDRVAFAESGLGLPLIVCRASADFAIAVDDDA